MGKSGRIGRCHKKINSSLRKTKQPNIYILGRMLKSRAQKELRIKTYSEEEQDEGLELPKDKKGKQ